MRNDISKLIVFTAGVIAASAAAWFIVRKKQEEINELREMYHNAAKKESESKVSEKTETMASDINLIGVDLNTADEYIQEIVREGYSGNTADELRKAGKPYVISPDEFGDNEEYETISLNYFSDGVLTDDRDERIEDVESIVGGDSLKHFGEYEDDSVFVRNDRMKCDYEILLDLRPYSEVLKSNPHLGEV